MVSSIEAEFLRVEPEAEPFGRLDAHRLFHVVTRTPAHRFDSVVAIHAAGHVLQATARRGFDPAVARHLLGRFARHDPSALPRDALFVATDVDGPGRPFDTAVHVPPPIARRFRSRSALLEASTSWIVPGHRCEFRSGHDEAAFRFGLEDGGIDVLDWTREPTPLIRAQLLSAWPGGMLRASRRPLPLDVGSLRYLLPALPATVKGLRIVSTGETEVLVRRTTARTFRLTVTLAAGTTATVDVPAARLTGIVHATLVTDSLSALEGPSVRPSGTAS
jgi:hypothetical protein